MAKCREVPGADLGRLVACQSAVAIAHALSIGRGKVRLAGSGIHRISGAQRGTAVDDHNELERPQPRSAAEIFEDLRALAQSDGALHEISSIIFRDWFVTVDRHGGRVIDDPTHRWSTSKLNKNELMLLLGLMVQSASERTYSVLADTRSDRRCLVERSGLVSDVIRLRSSSPSLSASRQGRSASASCRSTNVLDAAAVHCTHGSINPGRPAAHRLNGIPSCGRRRGRIR